MLDLILMILAIVCFLLAAANVNLRGIAIGWVGLALWALTTLT